MAPEGTAGASRSPGADARADLRDLAADKTLQIVDREPWNWRHVDRENAREAAVLMLFGRLDDGSDRADVLDRPAATGEVSVDEVDVLVLVRSAGLRNHAGQPAFPGGKLDPEDHEAPDPRIEAALREAVEETGVDRDGIEVLGQLAPVPLPVSQFMVTPVIGWWTRPSEVRVVDRGESAQVFRVPVRELVDPANRHLSTVTRGRATHKTPAFTVASPEGPVTIWGFTGILLDQLLERTGWAQPWDRTRMRPAPGE